MDRVALCTVSVVAGAWLLHTTASWRRRRRLLRWTKEPGLKATLLAQRRRDFCPAQSVSYANVDPLVVVEGFGCTLVDEAGRRFLDTRNNVAHVGHAHPGVASAVAEQAAVLNTNTRYLHKNVCELARRLLSTMPAPLSDGVVFFVNSGSEANDLALRLARAHAAQRDAAAGVVPSGTGGVGESGGRVIVVDHAYHGHTIGALALSPYKFEHKSFGGRGKPDWVTVCPAPDTYRGPHRGSDAATEYAKYVSDACGAAGRVDAFFIESGMSVAGVILPPPGYLSACYQAVRAHGGLTVADEVQTGLGRFGRWWWGFEQQGVVPDIVTMGKPMGNGMPLAAVVCTRAVSECFASGPEYFNTFGGNPVCAAAGLAVLDAIDKGRLRERAGETGDFLIGALEHLASTERGALIGRVSGSGLFVGVEFVSDRERRTPATQQTSLLCSRLKDLHRVLTSIDGPHDNVLVIKPPLCFGTAEAGRLVSTIADELEAMAGVDLSTVTHTPT